MPARLGELEELQRWLLERLQDGLRSECPEFVEAFEGATPEEHEKRLREGWDDLLGDELRPWSELLTALLDLEVQLDRVRIAVNGLGQAPDGRMVHFWTDVTPPVLQGCLERVEYLVKRARRRGIVDGPTADSLRSKIRELRDSPALKRMRDEWTHGAFVSRGDSWLGTAERQRMWEPVAMEVGGGDVLSSMYKWAFFRKEHRHRAVQQVAQSLVVLTQHVLSEIHRVAAVNSSA